MHIKSKATRRRPSAKVAKAPKASGKPAAVTGNKDSPAGGRGKVGAAVSRLKDEIALNREFAGLPEAAFLALVWTWQRIERTGRLFFPRFGITDVQFNVLMILWDYRHIEMRQHNLADILVVNRASAGGVLERMERSGWIERPPDSADRRARLVRLTAAGVAKLEEVRGPYYRLLSGVYRDTDDAALRGQLLFLDTIRSRLDEAEARAGIPPMVAMRPPG